MTKLFIALLLVTLSGCSMFQEGDQHGPGDYHIDFIGTATISGYVDGEPGMDTLPKWRTAFGPIDVDGQASVLRLPDTARSYRVTASAPITIRIRRQSQVIRSHEGVTAAAGLF